MGFCCQHEHGGERSVLNVGVRFFQSDVLFDSVGGIGYVFVVIIVLFDGT